ncbi:hypothetical protein PGT21_024360 [Puccinia graminis f. sp. tritici]|uniref:Chitin-binding type-4 domain-containing protein n=1 Tax=Puccinia graminis f. sp. tritici TaxID=56615 RepID=A0A5B0MFJ8_PUCGR|nr:hypothetical protein PGT21_024360 [Puccinia graminis f. sp. tritici]
MVFIKSAVLLLIASIPFAAATSDDSIYFGCGPEFPIGLCGSAVPNPDNIHMTLPPPRKEGPYIVYRWCDPGVFNTYCGNQLLADASDPQVQDGYNGMARSFVASTSIHRAGNF